jgi:hypothetical protein
VGLSVDRVLAGDGEAFGLALVPGVDCRVEVALGDGAATTKRYSAEGPVPAALKAAIART